jgi:hypothetical protein
VEILRYQHVGSTLLSRKSVLPYQASSVHLPTPQSVSLRSLGSRVRFCSNGSLPHYESIDRYLVLSFRRNNIRGSSNNKPMTLHGVPFCYFTKIHLNVILPSVLMCGNNVLSPFPPLHTPSICHYFCGVRCLYKSRKFLSQYPKLLNYFLPVILNIISISSFSIICSLIYVSASKYEVNIGGIIQR